MRKHSDRPFCKLKMLNVTENYCDVHGRTPERVHSPFTLAATRTVLFDEADADL